MAVIQRFSTTTQGALTFTGNTLGLSGSNKQPGNSGSVGGLITTDTTIATAPGWGAIANLPNNENITIDWREDSSSAELVLPAGAEVLYAELLWTGTNIAGSVNVTPNINDSINFTLPDGTTSVIAPDPATSQSLPFNVALQGYVRSANVTSLVQSQGAGTYTAGMIPIALNGNAFGGWTLMVAYRDESEPFRNLNIYATAEVIDGGSPPIDFSVSGFGTPPAGPLNGRVLLSGVKGDPQTAGDIVQFGPTTASLTTLSGPRNPANNFFASQINNDSGNIDTTGTFGTRNATPGSSGFAVRQGFDITNVDASAALVNNQTDAVFRFQTAGDGYAGTSVGIQIDVNAPNLSPVVKDVDVEIADIGDTLTYTITFLNSGTTSADNVTLIDTIPNDTTFVANSVTVNGITQPGTNPQSGVSIGSLSVGQSVTITFQVTVDTLPSPNPIPNIGQILYDFEVNPSIPRVSDSSSSNFVFTQINHSDLTLLKNVDKSFADVGETITYTFIITNEGVTNTTSENVTVTDTIPNDTSFIPGSINVIGNTLGPVSGPNPLVISLTDSIPVGSVTTVTFQVLADTIPSPNPIINNGEVDFEYTVDPSIPRVESGETTSNSVQTQILTANLDNITKNVDKAFADCGDTLTYTIVIPNSGNVTALNVFYTDTIPNDTIFVNNSLTVNGVTFPGINPQNGVNVGNISPGSSATVTFQVIIDCT